MAAPGNGPLQVVDPAHEELAAIIAAVHLFTRPASTPAAAEAPSAWKQAGRTEALR